MLVSPQPDQEGNKLQRQKILSFIYPIYNHNWRNISTIYICNKTSIKRNILTIKKKINREVGRAKDLSTPRYIYIYINTYIYLQITLSSGAVNRRTYWLTYFCYNDSLMLAIRCRNLQQLIHVMNCVSQSACIGLYINCKV